MSEPGDRTVDSGQVDDDNRDLPQSGFSTPAHSGQDTPPTNRTPYSQRYTSFSERDDDDNDDNDDDGDDEYSRRTSPYSEERRSPVPQQDTARSSPQRVSTSPPKPASITWKDTSSKLPEAEVVTRSSVHAGAPKPHQQQQHRHPEEASGGSSPVTERGPLNMEMDSQSVAASIYTHSPRHSRFSGRMSPFAYASNITVGEDPHVVPRFNEALRLLKGRNKVEYDYDTPTVVYVPHRRSTHGRWTNVSVERNTRGRYVVIEQQPIHTQFTEAKFNKQTQNGELFGGTMKHRTGKAPWKWGMKDDRIERQVDREFYEPYLPPIKPKHNVESKIGSLDNYNHQPGGGKHKIPNFKVKWNAESKIGSLPVQGQLDDTASLNTSRSTKLKLPDITPRFGAVADTSGFDSIHYSPGGSVSIRRHKNTAKSKVGSLDNMSYSSYGGYVSIPSNKVSWQSKSKIRSLDNFSHRPRGGNVQIFREKQDWNAPAKVNSLENSDRTPRKRRLKLPHFKDDFHQKAESKVGSLANIQHQPGGGNAQMISEKLNWKAKPKIKSHWGMKYSYQHLFENSDSDENFTDFGRSNIFTV